MHATAYTPAPTTNSYLTWTGSAYSWSTGSVSTAANLAGGSANSVPYQTSAGNTLFLTPTGSTPLTLQYNGSSLNWAAAGAVSSFSAGSTGLTPNVPTTGSITLGGVLNVANGGIGATSFAAAGLATTSSLSTYASLSNTGTQTFAGSINAQSFTAQGAGSIGDQKFNVAYGGYNAGLSPTAVQLGTSGVGALYLPSGAWDGSTGLGFILGTTNNLQIATSNYF